MEDESRINTENDRNKELYFYIYERNNEKKENSGAKSEGQKWIQRQRKIVATSTHFALCWAWRSGKPM
jgi:hypothetical protein